MSRLDVSSEPSMEDILASIRKIIAEEPPGSRPLPSLTAPSATPAAARAPEPAPAKPSFSRAFDGLLPDPKLSEPKLPEPKLPEPTGRPSAFATDPFDFPSFEPTLKVTPEKSADAPSDPTRSFAAPVSAVPIVAVEPQKVDAALKSVEDQLADLLDDTPAAALSAPLAAPEPTFTVSRAGFIPDAAPAKTSDPFEFDLGPSPFEKSKAADVTAANVAAPVPAAVDAVAKRMDIDEIVTAVLDSKPTLDALTIAASVPAPAPASAVEAPAPAAEPAVAITSAAAQPVAEPISIPVTRPGWAKITEIAHHDFAIARTEEPQSLPEPAMAEPVGDAAVLAMPVLATEVVNAADALVTTEASEHQSVRSMEDTVADLLRPMLRNWLHDNMPKIVERALAREMNEQNLIARKTAAE